MKIKLLGTLALSSALLLTACGQDEKKEESKPKEEHKKTTKTKKSENKKSTSEKPQQQNETDKNQTDNSQEQPPRQNYEQTNNQQAAQYLTKAQMEQRLKSGQSVDGMVDTDGDTWYQAPGGGDVVGYYKPDGTQCTVGGCMTAEQQQQQEQQDSIINRTPEEQKAHEKWVNDQNEWMNASETEREQIRKRDAEEYGYEYDPNNYDN